MIKPTSTVENSTATAVPAAAASYDNENLVSTSIPVSPVSINKAANLSARSGFDFNKPKM